MNESTQIRESVRQKILLECRRAYPLESCGLLLKKSEDSYPVRNIEKIEEVIPMENQAEKSDIYFQVDPLELYRIEKAAEKKGYDIAGFYHSHPDCAAVPSREDLEHMIPGMIYVIVSIIRNSSGFIEEVKEYQIDKENKLRGYVK